VLRLFDRRPGSIRTLSFRPVQRGSLIRLRTHRSPIASPQCSRGISSSKEPGYSVSSTYSEASHDAMADRGYAQWRFPNNLGQKFERPHGHPGRRISWVRGVGSVGGGEWPPQRHCSRPATVASMGPTPLYFIQTPNEVWMIFSGDHQVRRVYMDVPHSEKAKPSWYGESVGHYEGDTLVIDTIGQNANFTRVAAATGHRLVIDLTPTRPRRNLT
jgi:hypothetical protein